jgi:transposase
VLTQKQREIKDLLDQDKSIEEIADMLTVTKSAVYGHIRKMKEDGVSLPESVSGVGSRRGAGGRKKAADKRPPGAPDASRLADEFKERIAQERKAILTRREQITAELNDLREQEKQLTIVEKNLGGPSERIVKKAPPVKRGPGRPRKVAAVEDAA